MKRAKRHKNTRRYYLLGLGIIFLLAFFYVWQHIQITNLDYEITRLKKVVRAAENQNKLLKIQLYEYLALDSVARRAKGELKLIVPYETKSVVVIKEESSDDKQSKVPERLFNRLRLPRKAEARN